MAVTQDIETTQQAELADEQSPVPKFQKEPQRRTWRPSKWWLLVGFVALLGTAAGMRFWDLGSRALHHDESLHAYFSYILSIGDAYRHTPLMHGPFQFEVNAAIFRVFGDNDYTSRVLYAFAGTVLVGMPFLLRDRLGRWGAWIVAGMLAFSPAMFYFSRFARNDILMAVWTLGLVIVMWRYMDTGANRTLRITSGNQKSSAVVTAGGRNRYLYIAAALLALAFATKETAYLVTVILGMFLTLFILSNNLPEIVRRANLKGASPLVGASRLAAESVNAIQRGLAFSNLSRPAVFLLLMITLTLPQWSASIGLFQETPLLNWTNLIFASPDGGGFPTGSAVGGAIVIGGVIVVGLIALSIYFGAKWNWPVWWRSALIFYVIWVLLYSTFFTNIAGIGSGMWQSLGYWIAQQEVARGNQPWYYYFVISSIYEFLPAIFAVIAAVYYVIRKDTFGLFLVFWAVSTFVMYMIASEKMPWLLVNIALPLIVLGGRFLGELIERMDWRRVVSSGAIVSITAAPLFIFLLWRLAFYGVDEGSDSNAVLPVVYALALLGLAAGGVYIARRSGLRNFAAFSAIPVALLLLVLTVRAGFTASYQNGDTPVELLVFTQTSPDITRVLRGFEESRQVNGHQPILIDDTSGFSWPWAWYLRNYGGISYQAYSRSDDLPEQPIVMLHSSNVSTSRTKLEQAGYEGGELVRHRWWFPESTYRELTPGEFFGGFTDRDTWRRAMDYFLYREGVRDRIGSEDSFLFYTSNAQIDYSASP